jgi:MFS transporter, PHS family, inorganic phosphate transporter
MPGVPTTVDQLLDDAPTGRFHRRTVVASGMGFFSDAYDLFVISTVALLAKAQWGLSSTETSWVAGSAILGAFIGALVFGRVADLLGRRKVYFTVAVVMIAGALASAAAPNFAFLVAARFVLGLGIGGDYPVSAVLVSEFSNRQDRGKLVGLVFSTQAAGLVVGPLVAITLLGSGLPHDAVWRVLLGLGAVPAAAVLYLRSKMPESPRFQARTAGVTEEEVVRILDGSRGAQPLAAQPLAAVQTAPAAPGGAVVTPLHRPAETAASGRAAASAAGLRALVTDRRLLRLVIGTAGAWFLFDYAYYGNTLSLPAIIKAVDPGASLIANLALTLGMFLVFAVPGYALAVMRMDRVGHRRLQLVGFAVMAVSFLALGIVPVLTAMVGPFLVVFGLSYFFIEFGPNTTTFVLPSELFPTRLRTTGHGLAAGLGKLGAFIGVFLVPALQSSIGLRGMLMVAGGAAVAGYVVTRGLPEPSGRTLDDVSGEASVPLAPVGHRPEGVAADQLTGRRSAVTSVATG